MDRHHRRRQEALDRLDGSDRLIDIHTLAAIGGMSTRTARRLIQRGILPPPTFIGGTQIHRWSERAIRVAFGLESARVSAGVAHL